MPPGKTPLSHAELRIIGDWIDAGAKWGPSSGPKRMEPSWWSFRKLVRPGVPQVKNKAAIRNPIDNFIVARLEAKGLSLPSRADRQTLVRRAYFDLHGLPPTPEQVERVRQRQSPDAYES